MSFVRCRWAHRALHGACTRGRDHRLPARLPRPADREQDRHRRRDTQERRRAAPLRRLADRQQPRQAHQRRRLRQAWSRPGGREPADRGSRAPQGRRRRRPAHHRWRRHQHDGCRPRRVPRGERLPPHGRRAPQDDRQRRRADQAVPRCLDRCRRGRALRGERHRRAPLGPAHAHRARGHGQALRLAHGGLGCGLPQEPRHQGVGPGHRPHQGAVGHPRGVPARGSPSTSRPRRSACAPSWTRSATSTSSSPRVQA